MYALFLGLASRLMEVVTHVDHFDGIRSVMICCTSDENADHISWTGVSLEYCSGNVVLNVVMRVRMIFMFAFFQGCILRQMGLCSGEASLVMANTASRSATPGRVSLRCISDGMLVERMVWIGVCGKVNNLS